MLVQSGVRGVSPAKKICRLSFQKDRFYCFSSSFFTVKSFHSVAESCLQPAAPSLGYFGYRSAERLPSMQHAAFSAAACLPLGHYLTLPVRLACNLQPLAASAEQRRAFLRPPPTHALVAQAYNTLLRFRCCMCFCMLRCSMLLPAAERRPTVTPISYLEGRKC